MKCKGCFKDFSKLSKSHVIPEAFYRQMSTVPSGRIRLYSAKTFPKKKLNGVWDNEILCMECEEKFGRYDDYAAKVLLYPSRQKAINVKYLMNGYIYDGVNYELLKKFVISLLWRASISTQPFFSQVSLGPLEESAKQLIWNDSHGEIDEFSFVLGKFENNGSSSHAIFSPYRERWWGVNYYRFYLGGYSLFVKADNAPTPYLWKKFITNNKLVVTYRGNIFASSEADIIRETMRNKKGRNW